MNRYRTTVTGGYTFAELLPALALFGVASAALLTGFLRMTALSPLRDPSSTSAPTRAGLYLALTRILSDTGSDPWDRPPEVILSGNSLILIGYRCGQPHQTVIHRTPQKGPQDRLTIHTPNETLSVMISDGLTLGPWRPDGTLCRGILLSPSAGTEPAMIIPFGRQQP